MIRFSTSLVFSFLVPLAAFAQPLEKVTLRLDWVASGYHAIWYHAVDKGLFKAEGIDLEILEGRGSAVVAQTVGNGSVKFGTSDTGTVMGLVRRDCRSGSSAATCARAPSR